MKAYVSTFAKFINGNLDGEWLDLADYADKDDFIEACRKLHADERGPELMFADSVGIPDDFIGESHISPECWDLLEAYDDHGEGAVNAYCHCFGEWHKRDFEDKYRGEYDSFADLAEQLLDETGELEQIPEHLRGYFDYEAYGRDLRLGGDFVEHDGHYFRSV